MAVFVCWCCYHSMTCGIKAKGIGKRIAPIRLSLDWLFDLG